jgi:hypothetical protein
MVLTPFGLLHVPLDVQTCIDLTPEVVDNVPHVRLDPLLVTYLSVCPDGLGRIYAEDPAILPLITRSLTVKVPFAVMPPELKVKPPIPAVSLIAPRFNCAM